MAYCRSLDIVYLRAYIYELETVISFANVLVDGGWGTWGAWTDCTKTCGVAEKTRTRLCDNPTEAYGGEPCYGSNQDKNTCKENTCPGKFIFVYVLI